MKKLKIGLGAISLLLGIGASSFTVAGNHGGGKFQSYYWYTPVNGSLESSTPSVNPPMPCNGGSTDCAFGFINETETPLDGGQNTTQFKH
jgi:hypothetical protein